MSSPFPQSCNNEMIIIIITVIIIIIIVITFKGAIQDILQSPHCTPNRLRHVHSSGPGTIACKSHATHRALIMCNMSCYVPRGMKRQLSHSVWKCFKPHLFELYLLAEPLTNEGGEETGELEKNPDDELQKMPHTKAWRFKPQARLEPAQYHWWQARKADVLTVTPHVAPSFNFIIFWTTPCNPEIYTNRCHFHDNDTVHYHDHQLHHPLQCPKQHNDYNNNKLEANSNLQAGKSEFQNVFQTIYLW